MLPSYYFLQNLDTHSTDVTTTLRKCIRWAPIRGDTFLDRQLNFSSILVWDILTSESMRGLHFAVPTSHRFRLQRYGRSRFVMRTWSLGVWYNLTELLVCLLRRGINMPDSDCVILLLSAPERLPLENELFPPGYCTAYVIEGSSDLEVSSHHDSIWLSAFFASLIVIACTRFGSRRLVCCLAKNAINGFNRVPLQVISTDEECLVVCCSREVAIYFETTL